MIENIIKVYIFIGNRKRNLIVLPNIFIYGKMQKLKILKIKKNAKKYMQTTPKEKRNYAL